MKRCPKSAEPAGLATHRATSPNDTWKQFSENNQTARDEVGRVLRDDQGKLCAYCEIRMFDETPPGFEDFGVEHFVPKSLSTATQNLHLEWQNFLGVCAGGHNPHCPPRNQEFGSHPHCDKSRENINLTGVVLDPLALSPNSLYFEYSEENGNIAAHSTCPLPAQANASIKQFRLDVWKLCILRARMINFIRDKLYEFQSLGIPDQEAERLVAQDLLRKSPDGWPAFFSVIRWYLGAEAETHLREIGYTG